MATLTLSCASLFAATPVQSQESSNTKSPIQLPGLQSNGQTLLPNGWSLRPAGQQIDLGDFPSRMELSPDGKFAAVLHAGWGAHEVRMISLATKKIISSVVIDQTFQGIRFDEDGSKLFVSGAEDEEVYIYSHQAGYLTLYRRIQVADPKEKFVVSAIAGFDAGKKLLVCGLVAGRLLVIDLETSKQLAAIDLPVGGAARLSSFASNADGSSDEGGDASVTGTRFG